MSSVNTLLILSAGKLSEELESIFSDIPSILLPFNGKTYIEHVVDSYKNYNRFIIVLNNSNKYLELPRLDKVEYVFISNTPSLSDSIREVFSKLSDLKNDLSILFGDIYIDYTEITSVKNNDYLFATLQSDFSKWSRLYNSIFFEKSSIISSDSNKISESDKKPFLTFLGLVKISDIRTFKSIMNDEDFYQALKTYSHYYPFNFIYTNSFFNIGSLDDLLKSRSLISREFNRIKKVGTIVIKSSTDQLTLENEHYWYRNIPIEFIEHIPNVYHFDNTNSLMFLEYLPYFSFNEIYIFGNLSFEKWKGNIRVMFNLLDKFSKYKSNYSQEQMKDYCYAMYIEKTLDRVEKINNVELNFLVSNGYEAVDHSIPNFRNILDRLKMDFAKFYNDSKLGFNLIHGDFFLANLMFDSIFNKIIVVDPRGAFGTRTIYGDPYYDYSKLCHSFIGLYDLIIQDNFKIVRMNNQYEVDFKINISQKNARDALLFIIREKGIDERKISFIMSTLFYSMIPIHSSKPERQVAMYLIASKFLMKGLHFNEENYN